MAEAHPVGFRWVMKAQGARREGSSTSTRATRARAQLADHPRADPRGHRHRVPRRPDPPRDRDASPTSRTTSSTTRTRSTIINEDFRGHRGPRRRVLRLRPRDRASTTASLDVRGRRDRRRGRRARARDARRSASSTGAGMHDGEVAARRRRSSTRAASSRSCAGTTRATRRRWSSASAASRRRTS